MGMCRTWDALCPTLALPTHRWTNSLSGQQQVQGLQAGSYGPGALGVSAPTCVMMMGMVW